MTAMTSGVTHSNWGSCACEMHHMKENSCEGDLAKLSKEIDPVKDLKPCFSWALFCFTKEEGLMVLPLITTSS